MERRNLTSLREGETARVTQIGNEGKMRRRLQDLGIIEGTEVKCTKKSAQGNPVAYKIRGAVIALRNEDAREISVK